MCYLSYLSGVALAGCNRIASSNAVDVKKWRRAPCECISDVRRMRLPREHNKRKTECQLCLTGAECGEMEGSERDEANAITRDTLSEHVVSLPLETASVPRIGYLPRPRHVCADHC